MDTALLYGRATGDCARAGNVRVGSAQTAPPITCVAVRAETLSSVVAAASR